MAKILIFAETSGNSFKSVTLEMLGALKGHSLDVAYVGSGADASELGKNGAENVFALNGDGLDQYSQEGYANALKSFVDGKGYDFVFAGATALAKDLVPRLAGMFDAGMASECTEVSFEGDTFKGTRPMFAGKCLATVEISGPKPHFVTVRPNSLGLPSEENAAAGNTADESVSAGDVKAKIKEVIKGASEKADLTEANVIVSGGRAMKNAENFKILDELAEVLGATVGASRAAVDSGYAPPSMQVGQTGKTVSPSLYIACGISGAIQHLAGMRTSKVIVAINTDPDAPIFSKADYGIVGDLFQIVPLLKEELKNTL